MYLQRIYNVGMQGNRFWYSTEWNKGAGTSNGLPNCSCFAVGEVWEESEATEPYTLFKSPYHRPGAFPNAKDFYSLWTGKKGIEPKVGGLAVWGKSSDRYGHVAVVLDYEDAGSKGAKIKVCQSNYGGKYFEVKTYTVKKGVVTDGVGLVYVGCCYVNINDKRTVRNTDLLQVKVKADALNVRTKPNGTIYAGRKCPNGLYTVLDTVKEGDFTWAKLDEGYWIALNDKDGWTETLPPTENVSLEKRYETLKVAYDKLSQQYTDLLLRYQKETGKQA